MVADRGLRARVVVAVSTLRKRQIAWAARAGQGGALGPRIDEELDDVTVYVQLMSAACSLPGVLLTQVAAMRALTRQGMDFAATLPVAIVRLKRFISASVRHQPLHGWIDKVSGLPVGRILVGRDANPGLAYRL